MKEALKLALEALWTTANPKAEEAITAIKAALEQPAQEPVAWLDEEKKIIYWHNTHATDDYHGFKRSTPLYTTPQQRPWVGLTHQEISNEVISDEPDFVQGFVQGARWADALLKEKNT
jgi:hypothetical protein